MPFAKIAVAAITVLSVIAPSTYLVADRFTAPQQKPGRAPKEPLAEITVPQSIASMAARPEWTTEARNPALIDAAFVTVEQTRPEPTPESPRLAVLDPAKGLPVGRDTSSPGAYLRADLEPIVRREAEAKALPPAIAVALVTVGSNWDPKKKGANGEIGLMQVIPRIARQYGFKGDAADLFDPTANARWGVAYAEGAWRKGGRDLCRMAMKILSGHVTESMTNEHRAYCARLREAMPADRPTAAADPQAKPRPTE